MKHEITNIEQNKGSCNDRVWVYINNEYCTSIRARTWVSFGLRIGDVIDCEELKERENFVWKNLYNKDAWEKEKVRLEYVKRWIKTYISGVDVKITGFGANSKDLIKSHPSEKGKPDMEILLENTSIIILLLEVTGTEFKKGNDYWVRPDKIEYIQNHSEEDIWIALHYADDKKIVWLQPAQDKQYNYVEKNLKGAVEHYVVFNDDSDEVKTSQEFKQHLDSQIAKFKNNNGT